MLKPKLMGTWAFDQLVGYESANVEAGFKINEDSIIYTEDMRYYFINKGDTTDWGKYDLGHGQALNGNGSLQAYDSIVYHSENPQSPITNDAVRPHMFYFLLQGNNRLSMSTLYFKDSSTAKLYHTYKRR